MDQAKLVARVPNFFESVDVPHLDGDVGGLKPNCLQNGSQVLIPNRKAQTSHFHFSIPLMSCLRGCIDLPKRTSKPSQYGKSVAPQLEW
ncbi:hypothetical protein AMTRI_Chr02g266780 [Amborella trichopoda]